MTTNRLEGQSLGRYHILEQLGEGGMATVYKAFDTRLEREVAIKIIRRQAFPEEQLERILQRFEREAKALARMSHLNIVKVHDYGEYEGSPYLVLEYLSGGTLKDWLGKPMPWEQAFTLLLPIVDALGYAHEQKIIHRDLKPSNILLTEKGQPLLTDFGIAKILELEDGQTLTGTGVSVGTPEYMAPEQGMGKDVDVRTDVYALGVVLYEIITGRKPYIADTPMAVVLKHVTDPLPRPQTYVPGLPDGVERLLFKALAKKPEDRYRGMDEFGKAMGILLETRMLAKKTASPLSVPKPVPAAKRPELPKQLAQEAYMVENAEKPKPAPPAREAKKTPGQPIRNILAWLPWTLGSVIALIALLSWLAAGGGLATLSPTRTPTLASTAMPRQSPAATFTASPYPTAAMTITPEPRWITWGDTKVAWPSQSISVENVDGLESIIQTSIGSTAYRSSNGDLVVSPDNDLIAYSWGQFAYLLKIADGQLQNTFEGHNSNVNCLAFSPDGILLATGSNGVVKVWKVVDGSLMYSLDIEQASSCILSFSKNGDILAASGLPNTGWSRGDSRGIIYLWKVSDGSLYKQFQGETDEVLFGFAFSQDDKLIAAATSQNRVVVWDVEEETIALSLEGDKYDFSSIAFSPDDNLLASGALDGTIWIWYLNNGSLYSKWELAHPKNSEYGSYHHYLIFSSDGNLLASMWKNSYRFNTYDNSAVTLWRVSDGTLLQEIPNMYLASFSSDNKYIAAMTRENNDVNIELWSLIH